LTSCFRRFQYLMTTYHKCQLCEQEILLDLDAIASHSRSRHGMSLKDFNKQFMIGKESNEDENTASTSQSRTSSISLVPDKEVVKEEEKATPESPKDKLVENDKQWYNGNKFTCTPCDFSTSSFVNLKVHVKEEHESCLAR